MGKRRFLKTLLLGKTQKARKPTAGAYSARVPMRYFDHNATTPLCPAAREAWLEASEQYVGNPSSPHRLGARADKAMADAREQLASFLGCSSLDIVWTSGATE